MQKQTMLGVDVGGSGIKGGLVNIQTGEMLGERFRVETPKPSKPEAVAEAFKKVIAHFEWNDVVGCGFPSVVKNGVTMTAANIDKEWVGTNAKEILSNACGHEVFIRNDADLAGLAEIKFGVGKDSQEGTNLLITIGSGLGSALFVNGQLVPNTEFGHLYLKGHRVIAEHYAADSIRKREDLSWKVWGKRFNQYLQHLESLFTPNMIILGGGASKKYAKFSDQLELRTKVIPAKLLNSAGIIGAAYLAHQMKNKLTPA
ncbi:MAG: ROK family protein [Bacteroidota bacterium]